jgi:predicted NAD/FAD-binding protein
MTQKIAVIGAGISGLSAAWLLRDHFDVTLYEAEPRAGGHADTQLVEMDGKIVPVDTGFIVLNDRNYPNLLGLFGALGIATHNSDMSFAVSVERGALEYGGGDLKQLFAQKRNLWRPRFWRMVQDILRFNREAPALLDRQSNESLGAYLQRGKYGAGFVEDYILPMGAAIWSSSVAGMRAFPARHFIRFFKNHGLLSINDRPQWATVTGGSRVYVAAVLAALAGRVRLGAAVTAVRRTDLGVSVEADGVAPALFDHVIMACHADQSLAMLADPSEAEQAVLGAVKFQDNVAVLHTDLALMPRRRAVWSSWNYLSSGRGDHDAAVCLTYWMNNLQGMVTKEPLLVSLNPLMPPDPAKVLLRKTYSHPQFDAAAMNAQEQLHNIQGVARLWFAGAWTGWGFHEDGIASAVRIVEAMGIAVPWRETAGRQAA